MSKQGLSALFLCSTLLVSCNGGYNNAYDGYNSYEYPEGYDSYEYPNGYNSYEYPGSYGEYPAEYIEEDIYEYVYPTYVDNSETDVSGDASGNTNSVSQETGSNQNAVNNVEGDKSFSFTTSTNDNSTVQNNAEQDTQNGQQQDSGVSNGNANDVAQADSASNSNMDENDAQQAIQNMISGFQNKRKSFNK